MTDKTTPGNLQLEDLGVKLNYIEDEYHALSRVFHQEFRVERLIEMEEPPWPRYFLPNN